MQTGSKASSVCPQCRARLPRYDHKLDCTDPSRYLKEEPVEQEARIHAIELKDVILRAAQIGDALGVAQRIDQMEDDKKLAFEIGTFFALAAMVAIEVMTKEDAIDGFSRMFDIIQEINDKREELQAKQQVIAEQN